MAGSFIFSPGLNAIHFTGRCKHQQGDGTAANAAILNVLLASDRAINDHLYLLAAIWALNECGLEILQDSTFEFP
jgi:hypothetical protein